MSRHLNKVGECTLQVSILNREGIRGKSEPGKAEYSGQEGLLDSPIPWLLDRLFVRLLTQQIWGSVLIEVPLDAAAAQPGRPCVSLCPEPGRWGQES